jgi:hypothetical protein
MKIRQVGTYVSLKLFSSAHFPEMREERNDWKSQIENNADSLI